MGVTNALNDYLRMVCQEVALWRQKTDDGMDKLRDVTVVLVGDVDRVVCFQIVATFVDYDEPIDAIPRIHRGDPVDDTEEFRDIVRALIVRTLHMIEIEHQMYQQEGKTRPPKLTLV